MKPDPAGCESVWLRQLQIRLITSEERSRWDQEICEHHYLGNANLVGEVLRYVVSTPEGRWVALLGWSSPAWHLRPRDRWINWSEDQRASRLPLVVQNSRFLLLVPRAQYPNLASRALALAACRT